MVVTFISYFNGFDVYFSTTCFYKKISQIKFFSLFTYFLTFLPVAHYIFFYFCMTEIILRITLFFKAFMSKIL